MAVELVNSAANAACHQFHTKSTDVWAFGMVLYVSCSSHRFLLVLLVHFAMLSHYDATNCIPSLHELFMR